jgi:hypothetical protein
MPSYRNTIFGLSLSTFVIASGAGACEEVPAANAPGVFPAPGGKCTAQVTVSPMGGWFQLSARAGSGEAKLLADDVNGIAWIDADTLVFAVSPIYGKPGIFSFDCNGSGESRRLVAPVTFNDYGPNGADFFELRSVDGREVVYYYAPDVDEMDADALRVEQNTRRVSVD